MPKRKAPSPAAASVKVKKEVKREEHDEERPEDGHDPRAVDPRRIRTITKKAVSVAANSRLVVYWMSRDQRVHDNWALYGGALSAQYSGEVQVYDSVFDSNTAATAGGGIHLNELPEIVVIQEEGAAAAGSGVDFGDVVFDDDAEMTEADE